MGPFASLSQSLRRSAHILAMEDEHRDVGNTNPTLSPVYPPGSGLAAVACGACIMFRAGAENSACTARSRSSSLTHASSTEWGGERVVGGGAVGGVAVLVSVSRMDFCQ